MKGFVLKGMVFLILLGRCSVPEREGTKGYSDEYITVALDAYYLAGQQIPIVQHPYDTMEASFYVENEMELAKAIQYSIDNDQMELSYQSDATLNLDVVLEIVSRLNAFDLSLKQTITSYRNDKSDNEVKINHIIVGNLDEYYDANVRSAKEIVSAINLEKMNTVEKIVAIHEYIIQNCHYDEEQNVGNERSSFSAYGVFVNHKAVCTGYSRAFMMIAKQAGVPALFVVSERMNHSWNYVFDGDIWKYLDTTWNDLLTREQQQKNLRLRSSDFKQDGKHIFDDGEEVLLNQIVRNFF